MRILLVNKFYYRRGGDCIVTMNLEQLLKKHGHEVSVYAMQYPENEESEWNGYWPSNMSNLDAFSRPFGAQQVKIGFSQLIEDFKPDVVHLHNIHTQLSPVIAEIAHKKGIRVVWTLHDTKLVCPCYTCMRDGHWCEECMTEKTAVIKHRCMPGGIIGSTLGYLEAKMWSKEKLQEFTDLFLPPSQFMMETVVRGGYDAKKFRALCNFIEVEKVKNPCFDKKNYYVYLGRVNEVKGIRTLCKAVSTLPYKLIVIGGGELLPELQYRLRHLAPEQIYRERQGVETTRIIRQLRERLDKLLADGNPMRGDLMHKALNYLNSFWNQLILYLKDGRYNIDNSLAERSLRTMTVERRNSLAGFWQPCRDRGFGYLPHVYRDV